jgi:alkylmercury lyase-like protein
VEGRVHHEVISSFVHRGRPPALAELAHALGLAPEDAAAALRQLHDGHGLVLHPGSTDIWIAHPFSASPTAVWVAASARGWWAPCLWCAAGIVALAAPTSTIHARHGGEHEPAAIEVRNGAAASGDLVVHFSLPPRDAWHNVVHWCQAVLPFRRAEDIAPWCDRHGLPRGAVLPWPQVIALGRAWYGRHLDPDWRKHTVAEAQAIFEELGLRDEFWRLPVSDRPF